MKRYHANDVRSVTMETSNVSMGLVPGYYKVIEREILHKNSVAENEGLRDQIPIHPETFKCHLASSESG